MSLTQIILYKIMNFKNLPEEHAKNIQLKITGYLSYTLK